jgi:hypothetical protein
MVAVVCVVAAICWFVITEGASVSAQALVVLVSVERVERLPAASNASTPNVYDVAQVRLPNVYVVALAPTVATCVPFRNSAYPVTPTLSVDPAQLTPTDVPLSDPWLRVGAVGGCVSPGGGGDDGHAIVAAVMSVRAERFPAASVASTPTA